MNQNRLSNDWDEAQIRELARHYDEQTEDEAVAEDEAAFEDRARSFVVVPEELIPAVRELNDRHNRGAR